MEVLPFPSTSFKNGRHSQPQAPLPPLHLPILRRILTFALTFMVLIQGTVWATIGPACEGDGQELGIAHWTHAVGEDAGGCDHCCHASAHTLAIPADYAGGIPPAAQEFMAAATFSLAGFWATPPLKPPRS